MNQIERGQENNWVQAVCPKFSSNITGLYIFIHIYPKLSAQSFPRNYDFKVEEGGELSFKSILGNRFMSTFFSCKKVIQL